MLYTSSRYRTSLWSDFPVEIWKRDSTQKSVFEPKKCGISSVLRPPPPHRHQICSYSLTRYSLVTRTWNVPRYPQRNTSVGKIHIIVGREQPRIQLTSRYQESIQDSHSRVQVWSPLVGLHPKPADEYQHTMEFQVWNRLLFNSDFEWI